MSPRPFAVALIAPVIALTLAACAGTPASQPQSTRCNADAIKAYVGQTATPDVIEAARQATGAGVVRALKPNQPATMDYREDRITIALDDDNKIIRAACG